MDGIEREVGVIHGIDKRRPFHSWQGEGVFAGQRIVGLRFMGCNLACKWNTEDGGTALCDTDWTWNGTEKGEDWEVEKLASFVIKLSRKRMSLAPWEEKKWFASFKPARIVMVTGGEPMLRQGQPAFQQLIGMLRMAGMAIHVETNGTQHVSEWARKNVDFMDVSPKFGLYPEKYTAKLIKEWNECGVQVAWKFVIGRRADVWDLKDWLERVKMPKDVDLWLMGLTDDLKSMKLADDLLKGGVVEAFKILGYKNVRISPRLQVTNSFA